MRGTMRSWVGLFATVAVAAASAACDGGGDAGAADRVRVDGSSTVFPVTEAVAEEFMIETGRRVRVTVGSSGTGGGFRRFCAGETDINDASRPIKPSERETCEANGIEPIEVPVASDGIAITVNPANEFVDCLTVEELREIWRPGSEVQTWSDVRPQWPDRPIALYGPGTNSGTFDYFTEAVVGEEDASRADYTASEDDNVLVQGVAGDADALGYFGYAYYAENLEQLELVAVDGGEGCVEPSPETIQANEYSPLSRPLLVYVKRDALERPAVRDFMEFYLDVARELVAQVGYVPLSEDRYEAARELIEQPAAATATGG